MAYHFEWTEDYDISSSKLELEESSSDPEPDGGFDPLENYRVYESQKSR